MKYSFEDCLLSLGKLSHKRRAMSWDENIQLVVCFPEILLFRLSRFQYCPCRYTSKQTYDCFKRISIDLRKNTRLFTFNILCPFHNGKLFLVSSDLLPESEMNHLEETIFACQNAVQVVAIPHANSLFHLY
ncbi:hypothetical protein D915_008425 [Fasciola hepatica]|uniref:Uncharacterized protein n=1 Tax=Fasciola hepatica TaxID=6192 RepID=A0A4E0QZV4_FASHE|nr:hypothetical protein D915_008425 [Fasciola hepatica]